MLDAQYHACSALRVDAVRRLLGSLLFVERRARRGASQIEKLLRDYNLAHQQLTTLNISVLKQAMTKADFNTFSRAALLSFLGEFAVFLASNRTLITHYPGLTLQARCVANGARLLMSATDACAYSLRHVPVPPQIPVQSQPA